MSGGARSGGGEDRNENRTVLLEPDLHRHAAHQRRGVAVNDVGRDAKPGLFGEFHERDHERRWDIGMELLMGNRVREKTALARDGDELQRIAAVRTVALGGMDEASTGSAMGDA